MLIYIVHKAILAVIYTYKISIKVGSIIRYKYIHIHQTTRVFGHWHVLMYFHCIHLRVILFIQSYLGRKNSAKNQICLFYNSIGLMNQHTRNLEWTDFFFISCPQRFPNSHGSSFNGWTDMSNPPNFRVPSRELTGHPFPKPCLKMTFLFPKVWHITCMVKLT